MPNSFDRMPDGSETLYAEDIPESAEIQDAPPIQEMGVTGIKRAGGYVDEEFLPALRGRKAVQVFKEMSQNDSIVGAMLFAIDKLIREVEWQVVPADQTPEGQQAAEFLESNMTDMSHSWDDFMGEVLSMLVFGWSWHEIVYKRRIGPWEQDGSKKSKYTDGLFGIRKMPIRSQETLLRWVFDENGGIKALTQLAPPHYKTTTIPIERSLLFRTQIAKGNPEGMSILRTAYRSWFFKKRLEEFEAIGVERDLAGMPVARVPAHFMMAPAGSKQQKVVDSFKKMVRGVRRDENEGLVLPMEYAEATKQPLYDFELMSSAGARQFDTTGIIQRYEQRILMAVLADFILVGHEQVGSYSLHTDKTGIFRAALNGITKAIADTLNRHLVPRLFEINGWKPEELPTFEPTDIDPPDLNELASFITATAGAGMQWFPDPELEKFLRDIARLPEMTDETVDYKRDMLMQQQAMEYAQSQMDMLGLRQKADMTADGYSPEQAQMISEMQTPEMAESDMLNQADAEMARQQHPIGQQEQAMQDQQMAMEQQKLSPQEDDPKSQADHQRAKEMLALQGQADDKKLQRDKERQKLSEGQEDKRFNRDAQRQKQTDKAEDTKLKRENARAQMQEKIDARKHGRDMQTLREQMRQASKKPPKKEK